jgi:hypothetical protein
MLTSLNDVVKELQDGDLPAYSTLRMADWEALGRLMSVKADQVDLWDEIVVDLKLAQTNFLADGEIVIEAIDAWLNNSLYSATSTNNLNRWVTAREIYTEAQTTLFNGNKPDSDWPRSVKAFGKRLMNIKSILKERYGMDSQENRNHIMEYRFDHK